MSFESLLIHSLQLLRKTASTSTADRYGMPAISYVADSTAYQCRLQPVSGRSGSVRRSSVAEGDTAEVVSTHRLFCLTSVPVEARDRVAIDGITYEVLFAGDAAGHGHHLEVDLVRVTP